MPNIPIGAAATGSNTNPANLAGHQLVRGLAAYEGSSGGSNPVPVGELLQGGIDGVAYSETISAQGGTSPYTYAVTAGALPTGLSLTHRRDA